MRKHAYNLNQTNYDLLIYHTKTKIIIVSLINEEFFECQNKRIVLPARYKLKQPFYDRDVSISYFFLPNYKDLAYLINQIVQNK